MSLLQINNELYVESKWSLDYCVITMYHTENGKYQLNKQLKQLEKHSVESRIRHALTINNTHLTIRTYWPTFANGKTRIRWSDEPDHNPDSGSGIRIKSHRIVNRLFIEVQKLKPFIYWCYLRTILNIAHIKQHTLFLRFRGPLLMHWCLPRLVVLQRIQTHVWNLRPWDVRYEFRLWDWIRKLLIIP